MTVGTSSRRPPSSTYLHLPLALSYCLLLLVLIIPTSLTAPAVEDDESEGGCYYMFAHYEEGDRILTNEPCLNCTCHNSMLMCYLRVCPFTKPIGQDCRVEKKPDQCCPTITCPEVPVSLVTPGLSVSTTTVGPAESTAVALPSQRGCQIGGEFYPDGAQVASDPEKPCELCYCIRNRTACVMQECILHIEGCEPVFQHGVCCPVRYKCDFPLGIETTTIAGLISTTMATIFNTPTPLPHAGGCMREGEFYRDGSQIPTPGEAPCEHCYCMRGEIVCAVQNCGSPLETEGGDCKAIPPRTGLCCPEKYTCPNGTTGIETITTTTIKSVLIQTPNSIAVTESEGETTTLRTIPASISKIPPVSTEKVEEHETTEPSESLHAEGTTTRMVIQALGTTTYKPEPIHELPETVAPSSSERPASVEPKEGQENVTESAPVSGETTPASTNEPITTSHPGVVKEGPTETVIPPEEIGKPTTAEPLVSHPAANETSASEGIHQPTTVIPSATETSATEEIGKPTTTVPSVPGEIRKPTTLQPSATETSLPEELGQPTTLHPSATETSVPEKVGKPVTVTPTVSETSVPEEAGKPTTLHPSATETSQPEEVGIPTTTAPHVAQTDLPDDVRKPTTLHPSATETSRPDEIGKPTTLAPPTAFTSLPDEIVKPTTLIPAVSEASAPGETRKPTTLLPSATETSLPEELGQPTTLHPSATETSVPEGVRKPVTVVPTASETTSIPEEAAKTTTLAPSVSEGSVSGEVGKPTTTHPSATETSIPELGKPTTLQPPATETSIPEGVRKPVTTVPSVSETSVPEEVGIPTTLHPSATETSSEEIRKQTTVHPSATETSIPEELGKPTSIPSAAETSQPQEIGKATTLIPSATETAVPEEITKPTTPESLAEQPKVTTQPSHTLPTAVTSEATESALADDREGQGHHVTTEQTGEGVTHAPSEPHLTTSTPSSKVHPPVTTTTEVVEGEMGTTQRPEVESQMSTGTEAPGNVTEGSTSQPPVEHKAGPENIMAAPPRPVTVVTESQTEQVTEGIPTAQPPKAHSPVPSEPEGATTVSSHSERPEATTSGPREVEQPTVQTESSSGERTVPPVSPGELESTVTTPSPSEFTETSKKPETNVSESEAQKHVTTESGVSLPTEHVTEIPTTKPEHVSASSEPSVTEHPKAQTPEHTEPTTGTTARPEMGNEMVTLYPEHVAHTSTASESEEAGTTTSPGPAEGIKVSPAAPENVTASSNVTSSPVSAENVTSSSVSPQEEVTASPVSAENATSSAQEGVTTLPAIPQEGTTSLPVKEASSEETVSATSPIPQSDEAETEAPKHESPQPIEKEGELSSTEETSSVSHETSHSEEAGTSAPVTTPSSESKESEELKGASTTVRIEGVGETTTRPESIVAGPSTEVSEESPATPETAEESTPSSRVPGEGSCFVEGVTYRNGSRIPPSTPCQLACACQNSIVHCLLVHCPAAPLSPNGVDRCKAIYKQDTCCPTYNCTQEDTTPRPVVLVTPESIRDKRPEYVTITPEAQTSTTEKSVTPSSGEGETTPSKTSSEETQTTVETASPSSVPPSPELMEQTTVESVEKIGSTTHPEHEVTELPKEASMNGSQSQMAGVTTAQPISPEITTKEPHVVPVIPGVGGTESSIPEVQVTTTEAERRKGEETSSVQPIPAHDDVEHHAPAGETTQQPESIHETTTEKQEPVASSPSSGPVTPVQGTLASQNETTTSSPAVSEGASSPPEHSAVTTSSIPEVVTTSPVPEAATTSPVQGITTVPENETTPSSIVKETATTLPGIESANATVQPHGNETVVPSETTTSPSAHVVSSAVPVTPSEEITPEATTVHSVEPQSTSEASQPKVTSLPPQPIVEEHKNVTSTEQPPKQSLYPVTTTTTVTPSPAPWPYPVGGSSTTTSAPAVSNGACLFDSRVYMSAQQIPRDDPCDFCFCFRGDIICLQQSCPPPIPGCYEEPIPGFCCPRYECPVGSNNTSSPSDAPPSYYTHPHLLTNQSSTVGGNQGSNLGGGGPGCEIQGEYYDAGQLITATSGPCLECRCGSGGMMECDPRECQPEPMLRKMIEAISSR